MLDRPGKSVACRSDLSQESHIPDVSVLPHVPAASSWETSFARAPVGDKLDGRLDFRTQLMSLCSEAAEVDPARTRAAAVLDDALATVERGAAIIAVMTGDVMPVEGLRRRGQCGVADDRAWLG